MPKSVLDGYYNFHPESQLDFLLSLMPPALAAEVKQPQSAFYNSQKSQTYSAIKSLIYNQEPSKIHEDHMLYNLVRSILEKECTVNEASTLMLYYMFIDLFAKAGVLEGLTISDEHLHLPDCAVWRTFFFSDKQTFDIPSFDTVIRGCQRLPIIGGPYGFPTARHAIEKQGRAIALPVFLPQALKDNYNFQDMCIAHGVPTCAADVFMHDLLHAQSNENAAEVIPRLELIDTLVGLIKQQGPGDTRKKLIKLFTEIHDAPIDKQMINRILNAQFPDDIEQCLLNKFSYIFNHHANKLTFAPRDLPPAVVSKSIHKRAMEEGPAAAERVLQSYNLKYNQYFGEFLVKPAIKMEPLPKDGGPKVSVVALSIFQTPKPAPSEEPLCSSAQSILIEGSSKFSAD